MCGGSDGGGGGGGDAGGGDGSAHRPGAETSLRCADMTVTAGLWEYRLSVLGAEEQHMAVEGRYRAKTTDLSSRLETPHPADAF